MDYTSKNHSKYLLMVHLIFVCKYRKKLLEKFDKEIKQIFIDISIKYNFNIIEMECDKKRLEFSKIEYDTIDKFCDGYNIRWSASAWDIPSIHFLLDYDIPFLKIPSACTNDHDLLKEAASSGIPVYLSTGMTSSDELCTAMNILGSSVSTILHCVSGYPTPIEQSNLNKLVTLHSMYPKCRLGYSGHEVACLPTIIARSLGAEVIERHFTTDTSLWGTDQFLSLDPIEFARLKVMLDSIPDILGNGKLEIQESELSAINKLRRKI